MSVPRAPFDFGVNPLPDPWTERLERSQGPCADQAPQECSARQDQEAQRWQQTLQALDSIQAGKVVDGAQVRRWLASWGREKEIDAPI